MEFYYPFINNKLNPIRGYYIAPPANLGNIDIALEKRMTEFKEKLVGHINNLKTKYMNKSFGEILIGTTFNPSGQDDVQYVKNEFAKLANLAKTNFEDKIQKVEEKLMENIPDSKEEYIVLDNDNSIELDVLYTIRDTVMSNLINAQMSLVNLLTLKY